MRPTGPGRATGSTPTVAAGPPSDSPGSARGEEDQVPFVVPQRVVGGGVGLLVAVRRRRELQAVLQAVVNQLGDVLDVLAPVGLTGLAQLGIGQPLEGVVE